MFDNFGETGEKQTIAVDSGECEDIAQMARRREGREENSGGVLPQVSLPDPSCAKRSLLANMVSLEASDLHVLAGMPPIYRLPDTRLYAASNTAALTGGDIMECAREMLGEERLEKFLASGDVDFMHVIDGARFRINMYMSLGKPAFCVRYIKSSIPDFDGLGLPAQLKDLGDSRSGLLLVTGPAGSGKSTTLAAIIEWLNRIRNLHIVTLEDPVEYTFESKSSVIHQREVGEDTGSFLSGLKSILRQDPDVIMVGEMRDLSTISAALMAAETGHLVMATLHTKDASGTIDRIVDVFPPEQQQQVRVQIANTLLGVCCQQIMPAAGGGRAVATEMMICGGNAIANIIREGRTSHIRSTILTSSTSGMHVLEHDLARLVVKKTITEDVAISRANNLVDLQRFIKERQSAQGIFI